MDAADDGAKPVASQPPAARGDVRARKPWLQLRLYALAVGIVVLALGIGMLADVQEVDKFILPVFLAAISVAVWYGGVGPGILAIALSGVSVAYFFTPPVYSWEIDAADRINVIVFIGFAALIAWFSSRRRRVEADLRKARDELAAEVAERRRAEERVRQLNADLERRSVELEASNKELEAFAYSTSHDLRAPLRHLVGYSELLQKHSAATLDERCRRYVGIIQESGKRMGELIDDLLSFSRIGRVETQNTLVGLGQLVTEILKEIESETEGRHIAWKIGALPSVYGDRAMLRLALVNLLSNAVKFTRTRAHAQIEIGTFDARQDEAVVFIKDNGVGFDMKYVRKLFGVFQRLHGPETFEGTGIGLATVQRIMSRHGGKAWAEGVVDEGATFYFSVPRP
jgi:signal transduction histidine kinase